MNAHVNAADPQQDPGGARHLSRIEDDDPFAYSHRGHDFFGVRDHTLWADESEDLVLSARSGEPLAKRALGVFYDAENGMALCYECAD